jgi:ribosome assembly protein YihI (activator of Der GTPase)
VAEAGNAVSDTSPTRFEIEPGEAALVRCIFQDYANGRSLQAIAHALNSDDFPFPGKATRRGPQRRGWAVSAVRVILRNQKYAGTCVWNKRRFLKDPETGRRRPVPRPPHEWVRQERPELRIIAADLWLSVQERLRYMEQVHGVSLRSPARGAAHVAYSPYLLSGAHVTEEVRRLENQVGNLVRFLANGGDSVAVRSELAELESTLERLRAELATLEKAAKLPMPQVHPAWVRAKLDRLDELIREQPVRARIELAKHLDGDLSITPRPSLPRERRAEITGRVKSDSLLSDQEAVCLQVVAGAGFEPATFGL